jgi:hypothetical protein
MKPLVFILLIGNFLQAQTIAEVARRERERQAQSRSTHVITSVESTKVEEPKPAGAADQTKPGDAKAAGTKPADANTTDPKTAPVPSKELPKPQAPPPVDPVQVWNSQLEQLRTRIRTFQDQEMALTLQLNQTNNQVYATVIDPANQQRLLAQVGQIQQQLDNVRRDLAEARRNLDALQLQGPPKK